MLFGRTMKERDFFKETKVVFESSEDEHKY